MCQESRVKEGNKEENKWTYEQLEAKYLNLQLQVKQLKKANTKKDQHIRALNRTIEKMKKEKKKEKQHYKNGRRGARYGNRK